MKVRIALFAVLLVPAFGCDDGTEFWRPRNQLLPLVALDDQVAFVERSSHTAFLLDPADPALVPRRVSVGQGAATASKRNGKNQLLVLAKGIRGSASESEVPAELDIVDGPTATATAYPLTGRFDAIAQSDDGRFLVLHHSPGAPASDTGLFNPNEMTLVDLVPAGSPAAPVLTAKTIRSLGGVPSGVRFSPSFAFTLGPRTLAVVLSQNYVTLLDLDHPDRGEVSVPLCPQSSGCTLTPTQVAFDPDNFNIYVRVTGAKDIYQIHLTDTASTASASNDFVASLSMLAVGAAAHDMALYGAGKGGTRLAVAAADAKQLVVIEPSTSRAVTVNTVIPVGRIVLFKSSTQKQQALLLDPVYGATSVVFADLEQVESTGGLAMSDYALGAAAAEVHPLVDQGIVVLVASRMTGSAAITVVDLATRSFSAWGSEGMSLGLPTFETRNPSRLWYTDASSGLAYLNLVARPTGPRLTTGETWLDQPISAVVPLASPSSVHTGNPTRFLVATHPDEGAIGNLTVLDAESPSRAGARTAYGFLLANYLAEEQP